MLHFWRDIKYSKFSDPLYRFFDCIARETSDMRFALRGVGRVPGNYLARFFRACEFLLGMRFSRHLYGVCVFVVITKAKLVRDVRVCPSAIFAQFGFSDDGNFFFRFSS